MKIIIPVAGIGSRLRPHTFTTPKPLLFVAGKSVLDHVLDQVLKLDPEEIVFVVGFLGGQIEKHIKRYYSFKARFVHQDELLGLGFAVNLALQAIDSGPVMIVLGDTIVECDFKKFVSTGDFTLGLMPVDDPHRFGIAEVKDGKVVGLEEKPEKPKSDLAIIGLYYFKESDRFKEILQKHVNSGKTTRGEIQLTDALQMMINDGVEFSSYQVRKWLDCGKKETLLETNRHLLKDRNEKVVIEGSVVVPPVSIDPTAVITQSVVGPFVSIGAGAVINKAVIRNSIIGSETQIREIVLEDSLVGDQAKVRGEVKILNVGHTSEIDHP
ncbi:MAG: sugar nucleotidyltransferase [Candidatus Zixiibacteriota bacterium]